MSTRKFYRTLLQVEILSEEPFEYDNLNDIAYSTSEGDCSGIIHEISSEILTGKQAADALTAQGSDPSFFMLNDEGEDE